MSLIYFALAAPGLLMMYVTTLVFVRADAVLFISVCVMLLQVRAASEMYITGCYDDIDDGDDGDGESDVICLDEEDVVESERRKQAMSPRAPATKGEARANKKNSEEVSGEESVEESEEEEGKEREDSENEDEDNE
jgi:hypothetical protein